MGRKLSDDFPYIGYVQLPSAVTGLEYDSDTDLLTLTNANGVELQTEIFVPSEYVHKVTGEWDMQGTLIPAQATRTLSATIQGGDHLVPDPFIPNIAATSMAGTDIGIPAQGTGVVWSKLVVPALLVSDNLYSYSVHLANSNSNLIDQVVLLTGSVPPVDIWGGYIVFNATGFDSYAVIGNAVTNHVSGTFSSAPAPGDSIYIGYDYVNHRLVVQRNSDTVIPASTLNFTGMAVYESLFWAVGLEFSSATPSFDQGYLEFYPSTSDSGKNPFVMESDAIPPVDAEEGREYKVTSSGKYNGYDLFEGDFVRFYNGIDDLIITRIPVEQSRIIPPGITDISYDVGLEQLSVQRLHPDGLVDYLTTTIPSGGESIQSLSCSNSGLITLETDSQTLTAQVPLEKGFIAITDVQPQSGTDNVSNKVFTDDGNVIQSCVSSTTAIRVYVVAITGTASFKPTATINGVSATLARQTSSSTTWVGYADIILSGGSPYTITADNGEGVIDTASVTLESAPVVTSMQFSGAYPTPSQISHAQGQTVSLVVSSSTAFKAIEIVNDVGNALVAGTSVFTATTSKTLVVTIADRGNTRTAYPAKIRIQNINNTWSSIYSSDSFSVSDGVGTLYLNNTRPTLTLGSVSYPGAQQALKASESATVAATYTNVDTVQFTSPNSELSIAPLGSLTDPVVTRIAGGYNVSTANLLGTVTKTENATSSTASKVVQIADTPATITAFSKPTRLRSGPSPTGVDHALSVTISQKTTTFTASSSTGVLQGSSWNTSDQGVTYTRVLKIVDEDTKGVSSLTPISITNLAGIVTTHSSISPILKEYVVGGFIQRTVFANPWVDGSTATQREATIGTQVRDTSKLVTTIGSSTGVFTQTLSTYTSPSNPSTTNYAITGPSGVLSTTGGDGLLDAPANLIYIRDTLLASGNTVGTLPVIIEELI